MRKTLLATTALAFAGATAAGSASADDMLSIGVGGYMQQWIGLVSVEDTGNPDREGGVAQQSDSEIHFKGKLESDSGLTFVVKVEIEGNSPSAVDESQLTVRGEFGAITLGAEDSATVLTHHGVRDAGFGMLCGDMGRWIHGINECGPHGLGTAGHGLSDRNNITYFSPRINGVQFGATYIPDWDQEGRGSSPANNDNDAWGIGGNYKGEFGGANVAFSLGHYEKSQTGADAYAFTNVGLNVGMGAFSFDVAFATADDGMDTDSSADADVMAAGAMYKDGPMAVSLSHTMTDADDGTTQSGTLLSASYVLASGISWRNSLFAAERDRGTNPGWREFGADADKEGTSVEGSGFVTGFVLSF